MSDIVLPRSLRSSVIAKTASHAAPSAVAGVTNLPRSLANLTAGAVINGVVEERQGKGLIVLRTERGALTIHTPLPLKIGSEVTLQLQSLGTQMQAIILSVDNKPVNGAAAQRAAAGATTPEAGQGPTANPSASADAGETGHKPAPRVAGGGQPTPAPTGSATTGVQASPIQGTGPGAIAGSGTGAPLAPGMVLTATVVRPQGPGPLPAPAAGQAASQLSPQVVTALPPTGAGQASPGALAGPPPSAGSPAGSGIAAPPLSGFVPESQVTVRILAIEPPSQPTQPAGAPRANAAAGLRTSGDVMAVFGTVTGASTPPPANHTQGRTLVQTPLGTLSLPTGSPAPIGAGITLEILRSATVGQDPVSLRMAERQHTLATFSTEWSALREALDSADRNTPGAAQQFLGTTVPRPGPAFAAGILFFMAALRAGDVRSWLGDDATGALERGGHGQILTRIGEDFQQIGRLASEPQSNGWQTVLFPVFDGERLQQIRMYMRRHGRKDPNGDDPRSGGSRFVVEADLSRIGPIQLDGLVRKKQLDLILRTRVPLPEEMRSEITAIFTNALTSADLAGAVSFEESPGTEFKVRNDMVEGLGDGGVGVLV
jgi:hypothetical protein